MSAAAAIAEGARELDLDAAKLALDSATTLMSAAAIRVNDLVSDQLLPYACARDLVNAAITAVAAVPWETGFTDAESP